MEKQKFPVRELTFVIIGEIITSLAIIGVYLLLDLFLESVVFSYKVILGALLGSVITTLNFSVLSIVAGRVIDRMMEARGTEEKTDEEVQKFAEENKGRVQATMQISFIVRTLVMVATLVVAFIVDIFDVVATLVPLLMLKPILIVAELTNKKKGG